MYTKSCLKKALFDFYQLRTFRAEKGENRNKFPEIKELLDIQYKVKESKFFDKIMNVFHL